MSKVRMNFRIRKDLADKLKSEENATEIIEYYLDRHYNKIKLSKIQVEKLNQYLKVIVTEEIEEYKVE